MIHRIAALPRTLVAGEEEKLVRDDPAARRAAELVALESIALGLAYNCALRPPVQVAIAEKLKHVAVKSIAARLGYNVDHAARMQSVLGRQTVGLHVEFRYRVRERNGQIHVAEGVVIVAAIQQEIDAVGRAAGNRILARTVGSLDVLAAGQVISVDGHGRRGEAGNLQQGGRIAAVERQIDQPLLVHHLRDGVLLGFHLGGVGGDLNALRQGADCQGDRDAPVTGHFEFNALLHMSLETGRRDFELVAPNRKVGERIPAGRIRAGIAHLLCVQVDGLDLSAGNG